MKYPAVSRKGFTLIELLIVIALLGALAVGLLATIDPFEQLKKGRDTSMRNTVSEFYNANLRYYSTKAQFPWPTSVTLSASAVYPGLNSYVTSLMNNGELKNRFIELAGTVNLANILVTSNGIDQVSVCFKPESKGFQVDPATIYDSTGGTSISNCKAGTAGAAGTTCYFCVQ
jgi:prepilin-type N-terminal cleavage/methylation domain-containing protein